MPSKKKIDPRQRGDQPADLHGNETPRDPIKRGRSWRMGYRQGWDSSWEIEHEQEGRVTKQGRIPFLAIRFARVRDCQYVPMDTVRCALAGSRPVIIVL